MSSKQMMTLPLTVFAAWLILVPVQGGNRMRTSAKIPSDGRRVYQENEAEDSPIPAPEVYELALEAEDHVFFTRVLDSFSYPEAAPNNTAKNPTLAASIIENYTSCNFTIGVMALTPDYEGYNWTYDAVKLWVSEQNFSYKMDSPTMLINGTECAINIIFRSIDNNNATDAVAVAENLLSYHKAVAIVGLEYSSLAIPVGQLANISQMSMISTTATHPNVTLGRPYAFRMGFTNDEQSRVLALLGKKIFRSSTAAIIFQEDDVYSSSLATSIRGAWELLGGSIISHISFNRTNIINSEYEEQQDAIANVTADILFIPIMPQVIPEVVNAIRTAGWQGLIFGGDSWDDIGAIERCGRACIGTFYTSMLSTYPSEHPFIDSYNSNYNILPNAKAAFAYDSMSLIKDALIRYGKAPSYDSIVSDRIGLHDALKNTTNFIGVGGNITFGYNNNPIEVCVNIMFVNFVKAKIEPKNYYSVCPN